MTREMILAQCQEYLRLRGWSNYHKNRINKGTSTLDDFFGNSHHKQRADYMLKEIVEKCNFSSEAIALQFINLEIQEGNLKP